MFLPYTSHYPRKCEKEKLKEKEGKRGEESRKPNSGD
jgi:hypothetical protein